MQETYNIYFAGEIADGESLHEVRHRVGALFNAREATLDKLFSGRTQLIKRNCSHEEALKYQSAMQRAGAVATISRTNDTPGTGDSAATTDTSASISPTAPAHDALTLAPAGAGVLLPSEQPTAARRDIDVSALSVAPPGERLEAEAARAPAPPDTSHLSASDIGETIPTLPATAPTAAPDTSSLSIAGPDTNLLDDRYRKSNDPPAPDTAHLTMAPRQDD